VQPLGASHERWLDAEPIGSFRSLMKETKSNSKSSRVPRDHSAGFLADSLAINFIAQTACFSHVVDELQQPRYFRC
jgi:hypothetical protein